MITHNTETSAPTLEDQIQLEYSILDAARSEWMKDKNKAVEKRLEDDTDYGTTLIRRAIEDVSAVVREKIEGILNGKPLGGRPNKIIPIIRQLDPDVTAYIALKAVVSGLSRPHDLMTLSHDLGQRIEDQLRLDAFEEQHPSNYKITEKRLKKMSVTSRERRRAVMQIMSNRAGTAFARWDKKEKLDLGNLLLECVREGSEIITFATTVNSRGRSVKARNVVRPTERAEQFVRWAEDAYSLSSPQYLPTIIRPKRWTTPRNGGYWSGLLPLSLIKTPNARVLDEMGNRSMPAVYSALNRMQETPWCINADVFAVYDYAVENHLTLGGLPSMTDAPVPTRPVDIDTNPTALSQWKAAASIVHTTNAKTSSKRFQVVTMRGIAKRFSKYSEFYFPHQCDFRGRAYAVPALLNPQGPDYAKALLTFAHGKPINDGVAAGWLAIHGANLYGIDKVSFDERIAWVEANEQAILHVAEDPLAHQSFWTGADKPWQFLAFCFDYAGFLTTGYGYVSSLPVALDGSCNGLQHYSAALRDEVGGTATNLIPSEKPSDIYAEVARECITTVTPLVTPGADPGTPEWFSAKWLEFGIDRKIAKRSVMTLPYGSTVYSCREFIEEALRAKLSTKSSNPFVHMKQIEGKEELVKTDGIFEASLFLQDHLWKAIGRVVKAAVAGMGWLRKCASLASQEGLPVIWTLPDGFMVAQAYREMAVKRINTQLDGKRVGFRDYTATDEIDKRKMANGIAPNWVHSLDACALRAYVNLAYDQGIRSFGLVHDSYATVAADADVMSVCIRDSFASLYETNDVIADFRIAIAAMLSDDRLEDLPAAPSKGSLDIGLVRESDFFFA